MTKGTDVTHKFELPFSTDTIESAIVTYWQAGKVILNKVGSIYTDTKDTNFVYTELSVEDTNLFIAEIPAIIQLTIKFLGINKTAKSQKIQVMVRRNYNEDRH